MVPVIVFAAEECDDKFYDLKPREYELLHQFSTREIVNRQLNAQVHPQVPGWIL
jgi:hypothetical protein